MIKNILDDFLADRPYEDFDRDIRVSSMNLQESSKHKNLENIYYTVFGTYYSVFGSGDVLSCKDILGGILINFRFMTIDQFVALFPNFGSYRLSRLCHGEDGNEKPFFASAHYNGLSSYYYLSDSGHKHYRAFFPEQYLEDKRIPATPGSRPAPSRSVHDIRLRDVPYSLISIGASDKFDWYTSIPLPLYKTPFEAVQDIKEKDYINQSHSFKKGGLVADGIMLFKNHSGAIIIEQDAGTESIETLKKKLSSYEEYLHSIEKPDLISIVFNICVPNNRKKNRVPKKLHLATYNKIELLMLHDNIYTLDIFYNRLNEWIIENKPLKKTFLNMKRLIDEYVNAGNCLTDELYSLEKYIKNLKNEASLTSNVPSPGTISRKKLITKLLLEALNDTDQLNNLAKAVSQGARLIVTDSILQSARYIFPYESGLVFNLRDQLMKKYEGTYDVYRSITINNHYAGCCICIRRKHNKDLCYVLSEISYNIGLYYNIVKILDTYDRNKKEAELHLLIFVASIQDAIHLVKETDCIRKYCDNSIIMCPNPNYDLTIRFLEYNPHKGPNQKLSAFLPDGNNIVTTKII